VIDDEGNADFQAWAGIIEIKRDLERRYKQFFLLQEPFPESVKSLIANGVVAG
jgi:hypothetical protein